MWALSLQLTQVWHCNQTTTPTKCTGCDQKTAQQLKYGYTVMHEVLLHQVCLAHMSAVLQPNECTNFFAAVFTFCSSNYLLNVGLFLAHPVWCRYSRLWAADIISLMVFCKIIFLIYDMFSNAVCGQSLIVVIEVITWMCIHYVCSVDK